MSYPAGMQRIGIGYDSHRFAPDRPLVLGGVRIDHDLGLSGHSDADVVLHAVTDAILGAISAGDIGDHFADSDPQWAGAASAPFVRRALELAGREGLRVGNCDVTVIAEAPRLAGVKRLIAENVAGILGVDPQLVSIKATTNEGMGAIGRGEGILAVAVVLLTSE